MQTFRNDMLRIPLSIKRLAQLETFVYHMPDDVQLEESLIFIKAHFRPLFPLLASPLLASPRPSSPLLASPRLAPPLVDLPSFL